MLICIAIKKEIRKIMYVLYIPISNVASNGEIRHLPMLNVLTTVIYPHTFLSKPLIS